MEAHLPERTDWTVPLAVAAMACLVVMMTLTAITGVSQETFEIVRAPDVYAAGLRANPIVLRALFGLDSAFLILYASFFLQLARRVVPAAQRDLARIAVAFLMGLVVLDIVEDHSILSMLYGVENGSDPSAGQIWFQHLLSQSKFHVGYVGLFLFGLCLPRSNLALRALAIILTIGTVVQGAWLYAAPVSMLPAGNFGRWIGFLIGFALAIPGVRSFPPRPASGAAATGARA